MRYMQYGSGSKRVWLHPTRFQWVLLNATACAVCRELLVGREPGQVAMDLARQYRIPSDVARHDVLDVLETLNESHFLDPDDLTPPPRKPQPRSLFLHLTRRCNLSCVHCYAGDHSAETPMDLPAAPVMDLFDQIKALGGRVVTLSGGEPLLHPDIEAIMAHAGPELGIRFLTNGTLIDERWAGILADRGASVQVSIDGSCPAVHDAIRGKDSFEKAFRGIKLLQAAGLSERINIAATVMRHNLNDLPAIMRFAENLGLPLVRFLPLRKRGTAVRNWDDIGESLTLEDAERFYDFVIHSGHHGSSRPEVSCGLSGFMLALPDETDDDIWCPVGRQLVVDVDGSVYPCAAMMTPEFRLGSVLTDTVKDLFFGAPMEAICQALTERRHKIEKCATCNWRNLCQSGCMALALEHKGTIWDTDDFCEYRKKLYQEAFDRILALQEDV
jgi:radical SAM protein with 4Fe4S-binding SPASM domain